MGDNVVMYQQSASSAAESIKTRGKKISEEAFKDINPLKYQININKQGNDKWNCCMSRLNSTNKYQCYSRQLRRKGWYLLDACVAIPKRMDFIVITWWW
jgi:hypothetical protein